MPDDDLDENRGPIVVRVCIAMICLSTVSTALRIWSRTITGGSKPLLQRFWWDDWTAILALPFSITFAALALEWTFLGLGRHIEIIPLHELTHGLKVLYAGRLIHNAASTLPRISVLLLYLRVFGRKWNYDLPMVQILIGLNILQLVVINLVNVFRCMPVHRAWNILEPGHCIDSYKFLLAHSCIAIVLDGLCLIIPLPMLGSLQLRPIQKFLIVGLFICGYIVVGISIARLVIVRKAGYKLNVDPTWQYVPQMYCFVSEPAVSIFGICIPSIYALVKRYNEYGAQALITPSTQLPPRSSKAGIVNRNAKFDHSDIVFDNDDCEHFKTTIGAHHTSVGNMEMTTKRDIQVRSDVHVSIEAALPGRDAEKL